MFLTLCAGENFWFGGDIQKILSDGQNFLAKKLKNYHNWEIFTYMSALNF